MFSVQALDFVSLLLTKDLPVQASATINPALREAVPMGSLGADKLSASRYTDVEKLDNKQVAKAWKVQSLNKTVDTILESATRLEKEIEKETKYWEQILYVSDAGWALCRLPNEKHTLGVRFGFAEGIFFHRGSVGWIGTNSRQLHLHSRTEALQLFVETQTAQYILTKESQILSRRHCVCISAALLVMIQDIRLSHYLSPPTPP